MNKVQRIINRETEQLLKNEDWLYGIRITSFYKMRKIFKNEVCERKYEWLLKR
jgi:hypothetical protein